MKKIIYTQNAVISLIATMAITDAMNLHGLLMFVTGAVSFFVLWYAMLQVERWWLRHEKNRREEGEGSPVQGDRRFKVRYPVVEQKDRYPRSYSAAVQKRAGYNPLLKTSRYR